MRYEILVNDLRFYRSNGQYFIRFLDPEGLPEAVRVSRKYILHTLRLAREQGIKPELFLWTKKRILA